MDFTKSFIRSKNPCADGFRWYLRHHRDGSDYQQVLDDLVAAGRVADACWLLDQVGPTHTVLQLDCISADALVFAGSIEVRGGIDVGATLRAGGAIQCGGALRAGEVATGGDLRAPQGVHCTGSIQCGGTLLAGWHVTSRGPVRAAELKIHGDLNCAAVVAVDGAGWVLGDLLVGGDCSARTLNVRGQIDVAGHLRVVQGLVSASGIACGGHLDAGSGIRSGGDLVAAGAIRAGESISADGELRAGAGYGIFAGLCVQREEWPTSARVTAHARPSGLMSGLWTGGPAAPAGHGARAACARRDPASGRSVPASHGEGAPR